MSQKGQSRQKRQGLNRSSELERLLLDQQSTRYHKKLIDQRRHLSFAITAHQSLREKSESKIQLLTSRVHNLQLMNHRVKQEGVKYKLRLEKLYNAQGLDADLFAMTQNLKSDFEEKDAERRQACSEMKVQGKKKIEFSKLIHNLRLNKRVLTLKEQLEIGHTQKMKATFSMLETNRQKYLEAREREKAMMERAQRIQDFKLARARKNYIQKIQGVMAAQREKEAKLRLLQHQQNVKVESLKKTQHLRDESVQIERYLESTLFSTQYL